MRVCSSLLSKTCVFFNGHTILPAISTSTSMCFYQSTKQGNPLKSFRAVGQMSGSLNLHKAALPPMIHIISEKTFKVSCEESLTSFLHFSKISIFTFSKPQNRQNQFCKFYIHNRTDETWRIPLNRQTH